MRDPERALHKGREIVVVLIVDHEAYRAQSLSRGLRIEGHEVLEARSLSEALFWVEGQSVRIDLIITDCSTRILCSPAVLKALRERLPGIPVVTMMDKGKWSRDAASLPWPSHFIDKPFTDLDLIQLVESLKGENRMKDSGSTQSCPQSKPKNT